MKVAMRTRMKIVKRHILAERLVALPVVPRSPATGNSLAKDPLHPQLRSLQVMRFPHVSHRVFAPRSAARGGLEGWPRSSWTMAVVVKRNVEQRAGCSDARTLNDKSRTDWMMLTNVSIYGKARAAPEGERAYLMDKVALD